MQDLAAIRTAMTLSATLAFVCAGLTLMIGVAVPSMHRWAARLLLLGLLGVVVAGLAGPGWLPS